MPPARRLTEARRIIDHINESEVPEDDGRDEIWVWEYFLGRWAELARESGDPNMLTAIDDVRTDGGFSRSKCVFYRQVTDVPDFVPHYSKAPNGRESLANCWYGDDLRKVLVTPPAPDLPRRSGGGSSLTACEVDRQLSRLRALAPRARTAAVASLIEEAGEKKRVDPVGIFYLNQRLPAVFQHADDAVFAALDAAAKRKMTPFLCGLYQHAALSKRFGRRYRPPDGRELIRPCEADDSIRAELERALAR